MGSLKQGFVVARFFSVCFAMTGVENNKMQHNYHSLFHLGLHHKEYSYTKVPLYMYTCMYAWFRFSFVSYPENRFFLTTWLYSEHVYSAPAAMSIIGHFTVMDGSEAGGDLVFIQTFKLFLCQPVFFKDNFHNKAKDVCIKTRSPSASHSLGG